MFVANSKRRAVLPFIVLLGILHDEAQCLDLESLVYNLDSLSVRDFLNTVNGVVTVGNNVTIRLPEDLPFLLQGEPEGLYEADRRRGFGWGKQEEKRDGLLSVSNFFRVGCILFDLKEISETARNGLYGKKRRRRRQY